MSPLSGGGEKMEKELLQEIEESLEVSKVCFESMDELEELVTPGICNGGGCSCGAYC